MERVFYRFVTLRIALILSILNFGLKSYGGPLQKIAIGHSSSLLCDGRALVISDKSTEIFNANTGEWRSGPMLDFPRRFHSTILDDSCRVWILGGISSDKAGTPIIQTEIFDSDTNRFYQGPNLSSALVNPAVVTINGGIYVQTESGFDRISTQDMSVSKIDFSLKPLTSVAVSKTHSESGSTIVVLGAGTDGQLYANYYQLSQPQQSKTVALGQVASGVSATTIDDGNILITGGVDEQPNHTYESHLCLVYDLKSSSTSTCSQAMGVDSESRDYFDLTRPHGGVTFPVSSDEVLFVAGTTFYNVPRYVYDLRILNTKTGRIHLLQSQLSWDDKASDLNLILLADGRVLFVSQNHLGLLDLKRDELVYGDDSSYGRWWNAALPANDDEVLLVHDSKTELFSSKLGKYRPGPALPEGAFDGSANASITEMSDHRFLMINGSACAVLEPGNGKVEKCNPFPSPNFTGRFSASTAMGVRFIGSENYDGRDTNIWDWNAGDFSWTPLPENGLDLWGCWSGKLLSSSKGDVTLFCEDHNKVSTTLAVKYDLKKRSWVSVGKIPISNQFNAVMIDDDRALLAGYGPIEGGGNEMHYGIFDLRSNRWTKTGVIPSSVNSSSSFWSTGVMSKISENQVLFAGPSDREGWISRGLLDLLTWNFQTLTDIPGSIGKPSEGYAVKLKNGSVVWFKRDLFGAPGEVLMLLEPRSKKAEMYKESPRFN